MCHPRVIILGGPRLAMTVGIEHCWGHGSLGLQLFRSGVVVQVVQHVAQRSNTAPEARERSETVEMKPTVSQGITQLANSSVGFVL